MKACLDFVEDFRISHLFDELEPEEYEKEKKTLAKKVEKAEKALCITFNDEQAELFENLDDCIDLYVNLLEKDAFFLGFELAKNLFSIK